MQQAHELSQQKLNFRQHYFIVAIAMAIRYQIKCLWQQTHIKRNELFSGCNNHMDYRNKG
jgi:hypothetical protein